MAVESSKNSINSKQEIMERFAELSVKMTEVMKLSREIEQYMEMEQERYNIRVILVWHVQVQMEDFLLNLNMCQNRLIR